ncbi:uncharacterized protein BO80DRAFT_130324 [Aspergillus ibericus CBS 121593]|uniref:Transmembrane protein n=1 Tax=Aspergillus ibericus CBS 121593 TaxID=1448316 RepID=A0A395HBB9_9EURO|nr:hypothetical protein BO80DRAFT_130324 [Aspergillus ibericus CBS 121593]RAL05207.1 hypothetical protein BO80DRAFT_130324 [Aspergillus ibericus CBS 121593]
MATAYTVASTTSSTAYGWESNSTLSPQYNGFYTVSQEQQQEQQVDQETASAFWKFLAACSSYLVLVGFLVIPLAFGNESHGDKTSMIIAALVLVAIGYTTSLMLVCFQGRERAYLLHSLFLSCTASNLLALLNVLLNVLCRKLPLGTLEIASLSLPSVFALLYGAGALWSYAGDFMVVTRVRKHESPLTEEEMQRQQLQRLLDHNSKAPSPKVVQKTFRVSAPERINPGKGWDTFTPARDDGYGNRWTPA